MWRLGELCVWSARTGRLTRETTLDNTQNHEEQTATQVTPQQVTHTAPVVSPPSVVEALTYGKRGVVTGFVLGAIVAVAVFSLCGNQRDNDHNHSRRHWHRMERFHSTRDTDAMQHMRHMRQMLDRYRDQDTQPPFMSEDQGSGTSYQLEKMEAFEKALSDLGRQAGMSAQLGGSRGSGTGELGDLMSAWLQSQQRLGTPDATPTQGKRPASQTGATLGDELGQLTQDSGK